MYKSTRRGERTAMRDLVGPPNEEEEAPKKTKAVPVVGSFRGKEDPYLRITKIKEKIDEPIVGVKLKRSNYIQRAIKLMEEEAGNKKLKKRAAQKSQEQADENFGRLISRMQETRRQFGFRKGEGQTFSPANPEYREPTKSKHVPPPPLAMNDVIGKNDWMQKLRSEYRGTQNKEQIDFAMKLFSSWDDDGSGVLDFEEIARPMISLGLSTDPTFVQKLLEAINAKFTTAGGVEDIKITMKDFLRVFRSDKLADKIEKIILRDIELQRKTIEDKSQQLRSNNTTDFGRSPTENKILMTLNKDLSSGMSLSLARAGGVSAFTRESIASKFGSDGGISHIARSNSEQREVPQPQPQ